MSPRTAYRLYNKSSKDNYQRAVQHPVEHAGQQRAATTERRPASDNNRVMVDAVALRSLLEAVIGNDHRLRDLMGMYHSPQTHENPVQILIEQFNTQVLP
jgi:hypothetical protein